MKPLKLALIVLALLVPATGFTQSPSSLDMVNNYMKNKKLYNPHLDNCNTATEAFVPLIPSANLGLCIEKVERTELAWEDAREACVNVGKRLPEGAEWKIACEKVSSSLSNLLDGWEWGSNSAQTYWQASNEYGQFMSSIVGGTGTCKSHAIDFVGGYLNIESVRPFRCVR